MEEKLKELKQLCPRLYNFSIQFYGEMIYFQIKKGAALVVEGFDRDENIILKRIKEELLLIKSNNIQTKVYDGR